MRRKEAERQADQPPRITERTDRRTTPSKTPAKRAFFCKCRQPWGSAFRALADRLRVRLAMTNAQ